MKTAIYCFSGTGNSLVVARGLAQKLDAKVLSMVRALSSPLDETFERVGLVYPTYMYRPPRLVVRFFEKLAPGSSVFAVATHGGDPADVLQASAAALDKRGVKLTAGFHVEMPGNYTPFGGPGPHDKVARQLADAEARTQAIAAELATGTTHIDPVGGTFLRRAVYPGLWYKLGYWAIPMSDQKFSVSGSCAGCGSCAKVCPVGNITMADKKPTWNKRCEQCFGCVQWCNKHAIEMGKETVGVDRYHHPQITRREIIEFHGER